MSPASSSPSAPAGSERRRWTARAALRRAVQVRREQGLRGVWFGVLAETVYRRLVLVELPLSEPPALRESGVPIDAGFLEEAELEEYAALGAGTGVSEARERFRRGERCWVARHRGELVSARWVASGTAWVEYLERSIDLAPDEVYLYETFTRPDHRGRGVSAAAGLRLAHALAAAGTRRIVGAVLPENRPGIRAYEKAGYRVLGRIGYVGVGRRRRHFPRALPR